MPEERIYYLAALFFRGTITDAEHSELAEWVCRSEHDPAVAAVLSRAWDEFQPGPDVVALANARLEGLPEKIYAGYPLQDRTAGSPGEGEIEPSGVPGRSAVLRKMSFRKTWIRAAAVLLVLAGAATYFLLSGDRASSNKPAAAANMPQDVPPGGNKALLTLADGSVIVLDSAGNGDLAAQGNVKIVKKDGLITYVFDAGSVMPGKEALLNTISTPRGGEYHIVLPDGSKVWLNAESSITFPVQFASGERKVAITGEAYFEVRPVAASSGKQPFLVDIRSSPFSSGWEGAQVRVLGTHFNINAYPNETSVNTTLLEGSVAITTGASGTPAMLKPGEQGRISNGNRVSIKDDADLDEVMAWRNGFFYFSNADIQTVMRQLARWYNVDVEYAGKLPDERFEGTIPRSTSLLEVFEILKQSNLHVKLEDRKVTVLP